MKEGGDSLGKRDVAKPLAANPNSGTSGLPDTARTLDSMRGVTPASQSSQKGPNINPALDVPSYVRSSREPAVERNVPDSNVEEPNAGSDQPPQPDTAGAPSPDTPRRAFVVYERPSYPQAARETDDSKGRDNDPQKSNLSAESTSRDIGGTTEGTKKRNFDVLFNGIVDNYERDDFTVRVHRLAQLDDFALSRRSPEEAARIEVKSLRRSQRLPVSHLDANDTIGKTPETREAYRNALEGLYLRYQNLGPDEEMRLIGGQDSVCKASAVDKWCPHPDSYFNGIWNQAYALRLAPELNALREDPGSSTRITSMRIPNDVYQLFLLPKLRRYGWTRTTAR